MSSAPADRSDSVDIRETLPQKASAQVAGSAYVVLIEEQTALSIFLPTEGEVTIGRGPDCQVRLLDATASRHHARISLSGGEIRVIDLGSRNGTRVNGELVNGARLLCSGDVLTICAATLILNQHSGRTGQKPLLPFPHFRQRLNQEIDRALRYHRPLALLCLRPEKPIDEVVAGIESLLRPLDDAARSDNSELMVLLPEFDAIEAAELAQKLVQQTLGRVGYATSPIDGADADTLLAAARAAARSADDKGVPGRATEDTKVISLGERRIVLLDPAMLRLYALIEKLGPSDLPVLIQGETGTGKDLAAAAVHHYSRRREKRLLCLNCAALPENLVEGELFGYERGAFSGAVAAKVGLLEAATGGTLFLDEVGELPLAMQAKLLRTLESQRLTRLGDVRERTIDVRIVAATNRDLNAEIDAGRFRRDLYFRLSVARLLLPPLHDRRRELSVLARTFMDDACARLGRPPMEFSHAALHALAAYHFPGNVRELRNLMELVAATVDEAVLLPWHFTGHISPSPEGTQRPAEPTGPRRFRPIADEVRDLERQRMTEALAASGGVQTRAAELIGMPIRTFTTKLKQFNLSGSKAGSASDEPR